MSKILEVKNLKTQFKTDRGLVKAADGVSYHVNEKEIIGLVGESGCGKSVSQLSVLQLITNPPGKIVGGEVFFDNQDLLKYKANGAEMRSIRGGKIAMIFQEPMTTLNPVLTINQQTSEMLKLHLKMDNQVARERSIELLNLVGIPHASERIDDYPHQFSGGMRQRAMIAIALSCNPRILIADEPTTAVDVTIQAQVLELMANMVNQFNTSLILVTHNLGIIARYAHRIYVMYAGRIIESGTSKAIFSNPRHPYTLGLMTSVPRLDEPRKGKLATIKGLPPNLINMPPTCAFLRRCPYAIDQCKQDIWPEMRLIEEQHYISCYADIEKENNAYI